MNRELLAAVSVAGEGLSHNTLSIRTVNSAMGGAHVMVLSAFLFQQLEPEIGVGSTMVLNRFRTAPTLVGSPHTGRFGVHS